MATTPSLAGVLGQGETEREAVRDLERVLEFTVEDILRSGKPLPEGDRFAEPPAEDEDEWTIRVAV